MRRLGGWDTVRRLDTSRVDSKWEIAILYEGRHVSNPMMLLVNGIAHSSRAMRSVFVHSSCKVCRLDTPRILAEPRPVNLLLGALVEVFAR